MQNFAEQIRDINFKDKLNDAWSKRKPFAEFMFILDKFPEFRKLWFAFKEQRFIEWIENQLNH